MKKETKHCPCCGNHVKVRNIKVRKDITSTIQHPDNGCLLSNFTSLPYKNSKEAIDKWNSAVDTVVKTLCDKFGEFPEPEFFNILKALIGKA